MLTEIAFAAETAANAAESESTGILGSLGINVKIFIAQLINFTVVLFVLWRWAWKPILRILEAREKKIGESIVRAEKIEAEMKALGSKRAAILSGAEEEARKILDSAKASAEDYTREKAEEARRAAEELLEKGKASLAVLKERAVREARAEIAEIVALAAGKVIGEKIDSERDQKLIQKALAEL